MSRAEFLALMLALPYSGVQGRLGKLNRALGEAPKQQGSSADKSPSPPVSLPLTEPQKPTDTDKKSWYNIVVAGKEKWDELKGRFEDRLALLDEDRACDFDDVFAHK